VRTCPLVASVVGRTHDGREPGLPPLSRGSSGAATAVASGPPPALAFTIIALTGDPEHLANG
jgi:hypothetical protein